MNNKNKFYSKFFLIPFIFGLLSMVVVGCSDDDDELQSTYGYVQFKLFKSASFDKEKTTRATDQLDRLNDAQKVKVVMQYNGSTITQTLILNSYSADNAEFGLRSDKLKLLAGDYSIIGFYLYDKVDELIYSGPAGDSSVFSIVGGGLYAQPLVVDATPRGMVSFKLIKQFLKTRSSEEEAYPFSSIKMVSFTVKNLFTQEYTEVKNVRIQYEDDFREATESEKAEGFDPDRKVETAYAECDTVIWLKAGSYQISSYTTYSDKKGRQILETAAVPASKTFVVSDNKKTENAEVPIRLSQTAEYIKDYRALKAIWESLGGPNWKYYGEANPPGCNWNFNKDLDMWGEQPGVQLLSNGRVASISLLGFGARGNVPDEIGQLTELRILHLGAHDEKLGGFLANKVSPNMTLEEKKAFRMDYDQKFLARDIREGMSEILKEGINSGAIKDLAPVLKSNRISPKDVQVGNYTNSITHISKAVMRLTKLEQFYIGNSPITIDNFFSDIEPTSPYYEEREDLSWKNLTTLTDLEIYNCPKLTALPMDMLANLPEIASLNIACNTGIPGDQLKADWEKFIEGESGDKIQILYMGYNNLEEFPETHYLEKMTKLGLLDCAYNKIKKLHPFGKKINIVKFYLDNNQITEIPVDAEGYFFGYNDVEGFSCSNNLLTEVPNIFNAKSLYVMASVDFSYNRITKVAGGDNFKGINTSNLNLAYNKLENFPKEIFKAGSPISVLMMNGNGLKQIKKGDMVGPKSMALRSLDLTYNKLSELPEDFYATNMPYLYGVDVSYNCFSKFPYAPFDSFGLTVFGIRHQRDANGNRTLREWPTGIYQCPSLVALYFGSNDLRKIEDTISPFIRIFEIKDNPNISIDLTSVCPYIRAGQYMLIYDKTQDIRGCDVLGVK